jgi:hypothetical protein
VQQLDSSDSTKGEDESVGGSISGACSSIVWLTKGVYLSANSSQSSQSIGFIESSSVIDVECLGFTRVQGSGGRDVLELEVKVGSKVSRSRVIEISITAAIKISI